MDKKGLYTVQSAYRLGITELTKYDPSPSQSSMLSWWNTLWASEIPPKIKIFWWRIVHNIIPTSWNLRNNHIPASLECKLCGFGYETTVHALFWCPLVKKWWKSSVFGECLQLLRSTSIVDLLTWARQRWNKEKVEVFMVQVWAMWNLRNDILHGNSTLSPELSCSEQRGCWWITNDADRWYLPVDIPQFQEPLNGLCRRVVASS
ncbi:hypothetical protein UlMin_003662 [Ulmus minor]